jgi:hypothetical protein
MLASSAFNLFPQSKTRFLQQLFRTLLIRRVLENYFGAEKSRLTGYCRVSNCFTL